jgi:hypothetical protein
MEKPTDFEPEEEIVPAAPPRRKRRGLKAGADAETDFVIVHTGGDEEDRVVARFAMLDSQPPRADRTPFTPIR